MDILTKKMVKGQKTWHMYPDATPLFSVIVCVCVCIVKKL